MTSYPQNIKYMNNNSTTNEFMNNLSFYNEEKYSFSRYKNAIKTGLENLGDTSYLNAVLFALANIRNLSSFFLNPKNQNKINKKIGELPFSYAFERLLIHLYPFPEKDKKEIYKPISLFNLLGYKNIIYKSFNRKNPNDLICFILDILHNELISKNNNQKLNGNIKDRNNMIKIGIKNFKNFNNSIISNNFNWFEIRESLCNKCGETTYNFQTFNSFSLDIEVTFNYYKNKMNNIKEILTIYDCLEFYNFTKQKNAYCNFCNQSLNKLNTTKIFSSPNIFIFLLDRGIDFDNKKLIDIHFNINEKIDLKNYIENSEAPSKYGITGIVSINMKLKKYVSFCKSPVDKNWYLYNDEINEKADIKTILENHNNYKELIPCILIYEAII